MCRPGINEIFYAYDPHTWPYFLRPESERSLIEKAHEEKHPFYQLVAGKTLLDEEVEEISNNIHMIYCIAIKPISKKTNYYVSCLGDFIVEVYLSPSIQKKIDEIYNKNSKADFESLKKMKGKGRLVIGRSAKKAQKISDKILKEFKRQNLLSS